MFFTSRFLYFTTKDFWQFELSDIFSGRIDRRKKLQEQWYFNCSCPRCIDPSEFGTWSSSITCPSCCRVDEDAECVLINPMPTIQYSDTRKLSQSKSNIKSEPNDIDRSYLGESCGHRYITLRLEEKQIKM